MFGLFNAKCSFFFTPECTISLEIPALPALHSELLVKFHEIPGEILRNSELELDSVA